jgi:hypothetical protein
MRLHFFVLAIAIGCGPSGTGGAFDCTDPATCPDNASCSAGALRCGPNKSVEQCKTDGSGWMPLGHCADNQNCSGGQCSPSSCMGSATQCTPDGRVQTCLATNGTYSDPVPCPTGQACVGTGCIMTVCTPNARFCDGQQVRQCDQLGSNSSVVDTCTGTQMCANGVCQDACMAADELKSFNGCHFYAVQTDNDSGNDGKENDIIVANGSLITANVKVEVKNGATWGTVCNAVDVAPGMTHAFALRDPPNCDITQDTFTYLDRHIEGSGLVAGNAYRVTSNAPVVAYYFNSDDKNGSASSSGAEVLLPKSTWGKKYYVIDWPAPGATTDNRSSIDIVAANDGTNVTVQLPTTTSVNVGPSVPMMMPGGTHTFPMNEGDVLQLATLNANDDLTGTLITADKEIGVWSAVECMTPTGTASCDHMEEQLLPVQAWGENYVMPRVTGEGNCTNTDAARWRILAQVDNTVVTMTAPSGVTLTPAGPLNINSGQFQEVRATGSNGATGGPDFFISSQPMHPIFVMQMTGCEPAMVTAVPVEQYLPQYVFGVPDFFCTDLFVTRKAGTVVLLDGMALADSLFNPAGNGYEVMHYGINQQPGQTCGVGNSTGQVASHKISVMPSPDGHTYPAGIELYGVDINCSYGYVGGLNVTVINPIP